MRLWYLMAMKELLQVKKINFRGTQMGLAEKEYTCTKVIIVQLPRKCLAGKCRLAFAQVLFMGGGDRGSKAEEQRTGGNPPRDLQV